MKRVVGVSVLAGLCAGAAFFSGRGAAPVGAALNAVVSVFDEGGEGGDSPVTTTTSTSTVIHAYAQSMSADCRRHALELNKYVLSDSGLIDAVEVKIDFFGGQREIDTDGTRALEVNKYHLCAQKALNQTTSEWWGYTTCMFGLQGCLSYDVAGKVDCVEAASGLDDDVGVTMADDGFSSGSCSCTLQGVVDYCAKKHTSTTFEDLDACKESSKGARLFNASDSAAEMQNGGQTLWATVNGVAYTVDGRETKPTLEVWADEVLAATCVDLTEEAITPEEIEALPTKCNVADDDDGDD